MLMIKNCFVPRENHINELKQSNYVIYSAKEAAGQASQQLSLIVLIGRGHHTAC